jgi:hypothetical protein
MGTFQRTDLSLTLSTLKTILPSIPLTNRESWVEHAKNHISASKANVVRGGLLIVAPTLWAHLRLELRRRGASGHCQRASHRVPRRRQRGRPWRPHARRWIFSPGRVPSVCSAMGRVNNGTLRCQGSEALLEASIAMAIIMAIDTLRKLLIRRRRGHGYRVRVPVRRLRCARGGGRLWREQARLGRCEVDCAPVQFATHRARPGLGSAAARHTLTARGARPLQHRS